MNIAKTLHSALDLRLLPALLETQADRLLRRAIGLSLAQWLMLHALASRHIKKLLDEWVMVGIH